MVESFPRPVEEIESRSIPLSDGCRLAARIWLSDAEEFCLRAELRAWEGEVLVFERRWDERIPRRLV